MDLNSDIGELEGAEGRRLDALILDAVTSCNIACGGHAGDTEIMKQTVEASIKQNVLIGAHPSYPDRKNFGRLKMDISQAELRASLDIQVGTLKDIVEAQGSRITHLKAHGALYNAAAKDAELASLICDCAKHHNIPFVFGLPNSQMGKAVRDHALTFVGEGFVDRAYEEDGSLTPRSRDGAVLTAKAIAIKQAVRIAQSGEVQTRSGKTILLPVETLCLHGDTEGASELAIQIKNTLINCGANVGGYVV